jgi:MerR family transcriptional regulator, redox-sensitive transcriptional activator SoxR
LAANIPCSVVTPSPVETPAPRRVSGQRRYPVETVRTLAVVDVAQRAGLSLDEIKLLLAASPKDNSSVTQLRQLAERKLPEVASLIEQTQLVQRWLEQAADCCCPSLEDCPLFDDERAASLPRDRPRVT